MNKALSLQRDFPDTLRYLVRVEDIKDGFLIGTGWLFAQLENWRRIRSKIEDLNFSIPLEELEIIEYYGDDGTQLTKVEPHSGDLLHIWVNDDATQNLKTIGILERHILKPEERLELLRLAEELEKDLRQNAEYR